MSIYKHNEKYVVEKDGEQVAKVNTYRNPYHLSNCYIDFDFDNMKRISESNIFLNNSYFLSNCLETA